MVQSSHFRSGLAKQSPKLLIATKTVFPQSSKSGNSGSEKPSACKTHWATTKQAPSPHVEQNTPLHFRTPTRAQRRAKARVFSGPHSFQGARDLPNGPHLQRGSVGHGLLRTKAPRFGAREASRDPAHEARTRARNQCA